MAHPGGKTKGGDAIREAIAEAFEKSGLKPVDPVPVRYEYHGFKCQWPQMEIVLNEKAKENWRLRFLEKFGATNFEAEWLVIMERQL